MEKLNLALPEIVSYSHLHYYQNRWLPVNHKQQQLYKHQQYSELH